MRTNYSIFRKRFERLWLLWKGAVPVRNGIVSATADYVPNLCRADTGAGIDLVSPPSLSPVLTAGPLRKSMDFDGVAMTDDPVVATTEYTLSLKRTFLHGPWGAGFFSSPGGRYAMCSLGFAEMMGVLNISADRSLSLVISSFNCSWSITK